MSHVVAKWVGRIERYFGSFPSLCHTILLTIVVWNSSHSRPRNQLQPVLLSWPIFSSKSSETWVISIGNIRTKIVLTCNVVDLRTYLNKEGICICIFFKKYLKKLDHKMQEFYWLMTKCIQNVFIYVPKVLQQGSYD